MGGFALFGRTGSGKSTVASILAERGGLVHCRTGMECRRICQRLFGREDKEILNYVSDALRAIDDTVWLRAALTNCGGPEDLVLDSLRYEPDLAFAQEQGLLTVAVELDDAIRFDRLRERGQQFDPDADDAHVSEHALGGVRFDHVIANNGSRSDLEKAVEDLLRRVA